MLKGRDVQAWDQVFDDEYVHVFLPMHPAKVDVGDQNLAIQL